MPNLNEIIENGIDYMPRGVDIDHLIKAHVRQLVFTKSEDYQIDPRSIKIENAKFTFKMLLGDDDRYGSGPLTDSDYEIFNDFQEQIGIPFALSDVSHPRSVGEIDQTKVSILSGIGSLLTGEVVIPSTPTFDGIREPSSFKHMYDGFAFKPTKDSSEGFVVVTTGKTKEAFYSNFLAELLHYSLGPTMNSLYTKIAEITGEVNGPERPFVEEGMTYLEEGFVHAIVLGYLESRATQGDLKSQNVKDLYSNFEGKRLYTEIGKFSYLAKQDVSETSRLFKEGICQFHNTSTGIVDNISFVDYLAKGILYSRKPNPPQ